MSAEGVFKRIAEEFEKLRREKGECIGQEKATLLRTYSEATVCRYTNNVPCEFRRGQVVCIGEGHRSKIFTSYLCNYQGKSEEPTGKS